MGVHIHAAGHDDEAGRIEDLIGPDRRRAGGVGPRRGDDFSITDPQVFDHAIDAVGGVVDHAFSYLEDSHDGAESAPFRISRYGWLMNQSRIVPSLHSWSRRNAARSWSLANTASSFMSLHRSIRRFRSSMPSSSEGGAVETWASLTATSLASVRLKRSDGLAGG